MKIKVTKSILHKSQHIEKGSVIDVTDQIGTELIASRMAVKFEKIETAESPKPAKAEKATKK